MRINVLKDGDEVLSVTQSFIAVKRLSGEVDLIPLIIDDEGMRVDSSKIITIGYGDNEVKADLDNGGFVETFQGLYMDDIDKINAYDLFEAAKKVNNLGADLGLGHGQKHEGAGKELVDKMCRAGAISQETRNTIKEGITARNRILHDEETSTVTSDQADSVNQAVNEVEDKLENGFVTDF